MHIIPKFEFSPPSFSRRNTPFFIGNCKQFFDVLTYGGNIRPHKKKRKKNADIRLGLHRTKSINFLSFATFLTVIGRILT